MPKYRITAPDGSVFEVTAPEGATQDQVLEYAKSKWQKESAAPAKQQAAPLEDPGFMQSMLIGAGRTFDRVGKGMQQLYYGATNQADKQAELKASADEDSRLYKPLQEARPWATGIGEAMPSMVVPAGGSATLLGNVGRMALAGGLPGALEHGSAGERTQRGVIGGLAGASLPLLGAGYKTGKSLIEPLWQGGREAVAGRTLNRVVGDAAPDVMGRLNSARELVPGSAPTAAQVAESGGISALERSAAASNPEAYTQRAMQQSSARLNALRGIAKDDAALTAAETARDTAARPLYAQAKAVKVQTTPELASVLDSLPESVMATAKRLAKLGKEPLKEGVDIPATKTATGMLDSLGLPMMRDVPAKSSSYSGSALHYIKLALDDSISKVGEGSLGNTEKRLMTEARDALLEQIDNAIPAYQTARKTFADMSRPVNQMEVGQALVNKLTPALSDFGGLGSETAANFARALRDGDKLAANATGFKGATLDAVMDPGQMATLNAIGQDLGRKANAQNLGRGVGSDTFQKLSMQNIAQQSGMPKLTSGLLDLPGVSRATAWAYRDTDQKMQALLADALLDPKMAADLMQRANKKWLAENPKIRQLLEQSAFRAAGLLGMSATESWANPAP